MRHSAKRVFSKALAAPHSSTPRVITVDKNAAYPKAFKELKAEEIMQASCELRQSKYLNNLIEQDHRFMKRLVKLGMGFFSFETAWRTLHGHEVINMIRKGQMHGVGKGDILSQVKFIASLFEVASYAERVAFLLVHCISQRFLQHNRNHHAHHHILKVFTSRMTQRVREEDESAYFVHYHSLRATFQGTQP